MDVQQLNERGELRHLITLADLPREQIELIIEHATRYLTAPAGRPHAVMF